MNTSPITDWEGAEAYFTFGPNSPGVWISLIVAALIFVWLFVRMIRHENHSFNSVLEHYPNVHHELELENAYEHAHKPASQRLVPQQTE